MTLERREQALLDLVEGDRCAQCDALLAEARARAATLVGEVHAEARARVRDAFAEERRRTRDRVAAARAKLQTQRRLHEQQRAAALLELGWRLLPGALQARWRDADMRRAWIGAVVAAASRVLPRVEWRIAHDPSWSDAERQATGSRIAADLGAAPAFVADPAIVAGLRIAASGNVVDGTLGGLIADRAEVGARLLRNLEQSQ
jgi:hypothetical protein